MGPAAAGCAIIGLAGCGSAGAPSAHTSAATTTAPTRAPVDLPQLRVDFEVLNHQEHDDLTNATATNMFQAQTLENATQALRVARDGYLAFDTGLQHLIFPTSMSGDVTAALRADAQVEADYLSSIMAPTDVAQM